MDVFLVPVAHSAYELYCEHVDEPEPASEEVPTGRLGRFSPRLLFTRLKNRFHQMLVDAEREGLAGEVGAGAPKLSGEGW